MLGHRGVLFFDKFTEFRRDALKGLRQPLEDGRAMHARSIGEFLRRPRASAHPAQSPLGSREAGSREAGLPFPVVLY
jgi:hypothetical protein